MSDKNAVSSGARSVEGTVYDLSCCMCLGVSSLRAWPHRRFDENGVDRIIGLIHICESCEHMRPSLDVKLNWQEPNSTEDQE